MSSFLFSSYLLHFNCKFVKHKKTASKLLTVYYELIQPLGKRKPSACPGQGVRT